jgi:6-phosphofructokinase
VKTLAVLTNGGDTCALNASIRSIRDNAYHAGYKKIYGVRRGYQGLVDGWIDDITHREIDPVIGGSCLGSLRMSPTDKKKEGLGYDIKEDRCKQMVRCLSNYRVDVLVVIGGDGTLQATRRFQEWVDKQRGSEGFHEFEIIGFLKTIDNDIRTFTTFKGIEVALCPGFPSAVKKIASCAEDLRVTARTAERAFSVESMGRDAGWLAAAATFGGAEILLVPEHLGLWGNLEARRKYLSQEELADEFDQASEDKKALGEEDAKIVSKKVITELADEVADFYARNRNVLIAVAEGFEPDVNLPDLESFGDIVRNLYGPRKKVGATELVTLLISPVLKYYFKCLSWLCERSQSESDISTMVECALSETRGTEEGKEYHKQMKRGDHPLKEWDIRARLRTAFGLVGKATKAPPEKQPSRKAKDSPEKLDKSKYLTLPPYRFEIRPHRTDYLPRSGPPSSYDYRFATVLGQKVGQMLLNGEFGAVPALKEVVPYEALTLDIIKTVRIEEIATQGFRSLDFFNSHFPLQTSERIIHFFRTIMTGPEDLKSAIDDIDVLEM